MGVPKITKFSCPSSVKANTSFTISGEIQNVGVQGWNKIVFVDTTQGKTIASQKWYMTSSEKKSLSVGYSITKKTTIVMRAYQIQGTLDILAGSESRTVTIQEPSPPPPPPGEKKWDLIVETSVNQAEVSISGPTTAKKIADTGGTATFNNIPEGEYTITAAHTGYKTATKTITLNKSMTVNVFPEYIPPPQVCTPGEKKCMNGNLYICNQQGSGWELYEEHSPICQETQGCPDFWTDPIGAVVCWILSFLDQALHLTTGGFLTLLSNTKNFLNNFSRVISDFFSNPIGHVRDYVKNTWTWITDVVSKILSVVTDWWKDTANTVQNWINNAFKQAWSWITDTGKWLVDKVYSLLQVAATWILNTWKTAVEFWMSIQKFIWDWWNTSLKTIWDVIQNAALAAWDFIKNIGEWITDWWKTVWVGVVSFVENLIRDVKNFFQNLFKTLWDALNTVKQWILQYIADRILELLNLIDTVNNSLQELLNTTVENLKEWVQNYFMESLKGMFGWITDLKDVISATLTAFLHLYGILTGEEEIPGVTGDIAEKYKQMMQNTENILGGK